MEFNLGELLKNVSDSGTVREQIEYIKLDLIDGDEQNFYELSEIESLANNIATVGLQQPLRVRPHPTSDGRYMVVSGHRRRAALLLLVKEDPERWEEIACIVDRDTVSPALQQLRLIFGNANTRKMSSSDLSEQAAQVENLLYQLKEDGYEFPGRMRDHVAQVVQTSKTKLAKLKMIRDNLAPCWQPDYKKDILGESSAYELSRMPTAQQILLFEEKQRTKANIKRLYADDIKKFAERAAAIERLTCEKSCGGSCINRDAKLRKAAVTERYCVFCCDKCCESCYNLTSCKNACPKLKGKIQQIKADAKEKRRQEQAEQEKIDLPKIEKLQQLWYRFGVARSAANASVADVYKAAEMYYAQTDDKKMKDMEDLRTKFSPETTLPYGYSFHLSDARKLIAVADLLGCSLDYLFCRTDVREMAQDVPAATETVSQSDTTQHWRVGRPTIPGDYILLIRYNNHAPLQTELWEWDGDRWVDDTSVFDPDVDGVLGWVPMPDGVKESGIYLNSQCVTGLNPYGHCGSAACCSEPYTCCKDCPEPCNSRCGYLEDDNGFALSGL